MIGADLAPQVSTGEAYVVPAVGEKRYTIAALDLGIKTATPRHLAELGVETHVLPVDRHGRGPAGRRPGRRLPLQRPGRPGRRRLRRRGGAAACSTPAGRCSASASATRSSAARSGLGTYKLRFGHRGLNQPVLDRVSGTVRVTSHNHGFAVDAPLDRPTDTPYGPVEVSHVGLNDDVVEGLRCLDVPAFSVQFHPESAAGPHDAAPLFQRFVDLMEARGGSNRDA